MYDRKIAEYVEAIRANAHESDPFHSPDPIAFTYTFTGVLYWLMPENVIEEHEDEVCEVMDQLVDTIVGFDGSSWSRSRMDCVGWIYFFLQELNLEHGYHGSRLRALGRTLSLSDNFNNFFGIDFELVPPLYSC